MSDEYTAEATVNVTVAGKKVSSKYSASAPILKSYKEKLAAAFSGILSTRTDANTGIVTVPASPAHNIGNSDTVGVAWIDPTTGLRMFRYDVDVTAHTGTTISIDLGGGADDLPLVNTVILIMKRVRCAIGTGPYTDWVAANFGGDTEHGVVFTFNDTEAGVTPSIYPQVITKDDSLFWIKNMIGPGFTINTSGVGNDVDNGICRTADLYNFSTSPNNVTGNWLHN